MDKVKDTSRVTPPATETELCDWIQLVRSRRVGPSTFFRLMEEHGSAGDALGALPEVPRQAGVEDYQICARETAEAELRAGRLAGGVIVPFGDNRYPKQLATLTDAPPFIWAMGQVDLLQRTCVAVIGARNASSLGERLAKRTAKEIGECDITVVSGLARGIDAAAHHGAIHTGTVAVMPGGVDVVYPKENASLAQEILERGLRISEQPPGLVPLARHFPVRNRLVSGLSRAVVVIEAAAKSGSLITAKTALDQGREVLAVPGHPFDARSSGCNMLIRDGALLVRSAGDVIEALGPRDGQSTAISGTTESCVSCDPDVDLDKGLANLPNQIIDAITPAPVTEDQVIRALKRPASVVSPAILQLEMDGRLVRQPGGRIART